MKRFFEKFLSFLTAALMLLNVVAPTVATAATGDFGPLRDSATYPPRLVARISTNDMANLTFGSNDRYYVYAVVKDAWNNPVAYGLEKINMSNQNSIDVPITEWKDAEGNAKDYRFTGNEEAH